MQNPKVGEIRDSRLDICGSFLLRRERSQIFYSNTPKKSKIKEWFLNAELRMTPECCRCCPKTKPTKPNQNNRLKIEQLQVQKIMAYKHHKETK